jgi:hypothetical protein
MQRAACDHALSLSMLHRGPCPTPPADLILAGSDYHDGSFSAPSFNNILPARKCLCNKQGKNTVGVLSLLFYIFLFHRVKKIKKQNKI